MKIKILILIFVALTSEGWAQAEGGGIGNYILIPIMFIVLWIFYKVSKSPIKESFNNRNGSEHRLEKLQLLRVKDLITEEEYENNKEEILKKL